MSHYFKYLHAGAQERQWGLYVTSTGFSRVLPHQDYPAQQHPDTHAFRWDKGRILEDYFLVFISRGKGVYASAKSQPVAVGEGDCFFLFPGVWHRYKPDPASGWEEYWVGFNGDYAVRLMEGGIFEPGAPVINAGLDNQLLHLYQQLIHTVQEGQIGYPQQLPGFVLQMLGRMHTMLSFHPNNADPASMQIAKAKFRIQESMESKLDMQQLAAELHMSYSSFRKIFREQTGQSPHQYHLKARLDKAAYLLDNSLLNINEISDYTGFESVYYFSRLFRKKTGLSPTAYRKSAR